VEPDETKKGYRKPGTYPSLMGSCPPLILDGNFGYVAGVTEMILQSHLGEIHLLPAIPDAWPSGRVNGLCARGGYSLDLEWKEGALVRAVIYPKKSGVCRVRYLEKTVELELEANTPYYLDHNTF
jgi:alpha-L-fucosidase 2